MLTREIAARVAEDACVVATDLNRPMLEVARSRLAGDARFGWQQVDAQNLPFDDELVDGVVCQFGLMFLPDKVQGYREARRVLKPGGRLLFNVWDRLSENEFEHVVTEALESVFPDDPPRFLARTPHGYHDRARIEDELHAAGFSDIRIEVVDEVSRAPSPRAVAVALCQGTPLRAEIEARDADKLEAATDVAEAALAHRFGTGAIEGRMRALVVTATR